ncbi:MAG: GNAT family N-acetyltransferase [Hyphomicrobiaceae bacterium]
MTTAPTIETARLRLRGFCASDHDAFADYCANPETMRFLGGPIEKADAWRRLATLAGQWMLLGYGPFAVEERASGRFAGYAGPWFPFGWPEPEIMWGLHRDFHARGIATEAAGAARDWAYDVLGWTTSISLIHPDNQASQRVAERLGATRDGEFTIRGLTVEVHRHPAPVKERPTIN